MKNYVPISKRSKKAQKEINDSKRGSWNGLNPVTRIAPDKKKYDRKQQKRDFLREVKN